jgi:hypothetical protein
MEQRGYDKSTTWNLSTYSYPWNIPQGGNHSLPVEKEQKRECQ